MPEQERRITDTNKRRSDQNTDRESLNTYREQDNTRREGINDNKEYLAHADMKSVDDLMAGSDARLDTLRTIVSGLAVDEKEAATRLASAVAIATLASIVHDEIVVSVDATNIIVYTNSAPDKLLGYTAEELTGQSLLILIPERHRESHARGFTHYIETGEKRYASWRDIPITALHKDGTEMAVTVSFEDVQVLGRRMIVGVMRKLNAVISDAVMDKIADRVIERTTDKTGGSANA